MVSRLCRSKLVWLFLFVFMVHPVTAEFYTWIDNSGIKRISNIPPQGVREDGTLIDAYDPRSSVYQRRRVMAILEYENELIEAEAADARLEAPPTKRPSVPQEGLMNLDELIELGKRGGRYEVR